MNSTAHLQCISHSLPSSGSTKVLLRTLALFGDLNNVEKFDGVITNLNETIREVRLRGQYQCLYNKGWIEAGRFGDYIEAGQS